MVQAVNHTQSQHGSLFALAAIDWNISLICGLNRADTSTIYWNDENHLYIHCYDCWLV